MSSDDDFQCTWNGFEKFSRNLPILMVINIRRVESQTDNKKYKNNKNNNDHSLFLPGG